MKKYALAVLMAVLVGSAFCQDARVITDILAKDRATNTDFAYLIASQTGMTSTPFEAYAWCDRFGSFPLDSDAGTPITVYTVSHFLMNNYGIKGGLLWSAFHNSRYAWKELKASGFWKTGTDPDTVLSGRDLMRAVGKFFQDHPDAQLKNPPTQEASEQYLKALLAQEEK
jgi:hypothetical protein